MPVRALRGATTIDDDSPEQINERVKTLLHELFQRNGLSTDDVISLIVTGTGDIRSLHPATACRAFGLPDVPILGAQELAIDGMLSGCIRVLLHIETDRDRHDLRHVFLERATVLRPDLVDPAAAGDG